MKTESNVTAPTQFLQVNNEAYAYRRFGNGSGVPLLFLQHLEKRLATSPAIAVPTITMEGDANGAPHLEANSYAKKFSGKYSHRTITGGIGHNLPQEAPQAFAKAIVDVDGY